MAKAKAKPADKFGDAALKLRQASLAPSPSNHKTRSDSVAKSATEALMNAKRKLDKAEADSLISCDAMGNGENFLFTIRIRHCNKFILKRHHPFHRKITRGSHYIHIVGNDLSALNVKKTIWHQKKNCSFVNNWDLLYIVGTQFT